METLTSNASIITATATVAAAIAVSLHSANNEKKKIKGNVTIVVSTLSNTRGSKDMGLPTSMSQETIDTIVATAAVVAPQVCDEDFKILYHCIIFR